MAADDSFGQWLKGRRKELDLTQDELAAQVGCSVSTVRRLEQGALRPSRQLAELLAIGLDVAPEDRPALVRRARTVEARPRAAPSGNGAAAAATGEPANPYKGLRAFQETDASDFFGREALTRRLRERIGEEADLARFLAVVGASGAGKSSVVRAGLVPTLRREGLPGGAQPVIVQIVPGAHPLEELEAGLLRVAVNPPGSLIDQLREDERGLVRAVKRVLPEDESSELLLVIDQFEELFTQVREEARRADFIDSLFAAVSDPRGRLRVVVTLRADFYDRPLRYLPSTELLNRRSELVGPLAADELYRAIVAPAERRGLELESGLVAAIIQDVAEQPGMLPLMEFALTELYERREGRRLTLAAYRASSGVSGALARRAESLYVGLSAAEQAETRQLFLRLVTIDEGVEDTRRRVLLSEVRSAARDEAALQQVLDLYGRYRMLTFDRAPVGGGPTVEVAHEALLGSWDRLNGWLAESRERLLVQRQLLFAAAGWQRSGREASFLASGARLVQFAELAAQGDAPGAVALTAGERKYVASSLEEQQWREAEARAQQARELALQKRAASRLRYLLGGLAIFLLIAAGLAAWALNRSEVAQANFAHADALRLAAEANNLLSAHGPAELIALLSIRSIGRQYSPQADADLSLAADLSYPVRRFNHGGAVWNLEFSPDGKYLLTACFDNTARLWDVATGRLVRTFTGHTASVNTARFSPDGALIVTGSDDHTARIWDVATGKTIRIFDQHPQAIGADFTPDGRYVLTFGLDNTGRMWDAATGRQQARVFTGAGGVFSPDGRYVALASGEENAVQLWDAATDRQLYAVRPAGFMVFSPDSKYLLIGSGDQIARLWDVGGGQLVQVFAGHSGAINNVAYSPDGKYALTAAADNTARLWDVASGQTLQILAEHASPVFGVAFSPDNKWLGTGGSGDGLALLWNGPTGSAAAPGLPRFAGHTDSVWTAFFSPDGRKIVTASNDHTVRIWDGASGKELQRITADEVEARDAVFSPDGKTLLTSGGDNTAKLWDAASGKQLLTFRGHTGEVEKVLFSPDGKRAVTASADRTARVWDVAAGRELVRFTGHTAGVWSLAFAPGGKLVATGGDDTTARVWDPETGKEVRVFRGHTGTVFDVAFSPDGKYLLTAGGDGTARLWDAVTGKERRRFLGHIGDVDAVAFSPDGRYVLTGGADQTVRLWNAETGQELRRFTGHHGVVDSVRFSADGKYVLTASQDQTARLWYTDYHDTIHYLCGLLTGDLTPDERTQYGIADQGPTCPAR